MVGCRILAANGRAALRRGRPGACCIRRVSVSSIGDGRVLVEATVTGTHTGVLQLPHGVVLQPSGRSVSLQFVLLMRFVDGRLVQERLFFDHHELIHQLTSAA